MTLESYVQGFGCIPNPTPSDRARAVILPAPLDWGVGEMPGVALGPMAILGASRFIETFDAELAMDPLERGVATLDAIELTYESEDQPLAQIETSVMSVFEQGKAPLVIGGERTIVLPASSASRRAHGDIGVIVLTRRPGLLKQQAGRRKSPATLGLRLSESGPCAILGARFWSRAEQEAILSASAPPIVSARTVETHPELDDEICAMLPENVHLSIDVGVMDPSHLPVSGNIEPGGLSWFALTSLVDSIFERKTVSSCDVSGFAPVLGQIAPSIVVAQLVLRCLCHLTKETSRRS